MSSSLVHLVSAVPISLAIKACHHGFKIYFTTMDTLIKKLKKGIARQKTYFSSSLAVVDEVGYLPVTIQDAYLFSQSSPIVTNEARLSSPPTKASATGENCSETR